MEEVEEPKKHENLQTKPVLDPFQQHRRYTKSTRITTKNEHQRSREAGNYENLQTSVAATPKLRKFTDETNMQARNHENSDELCTEPRPPPRSSHPGFLLLP